MLDCNGNFNETIKLSTMDYMSIKTIIEVFNATIKPILLYGSEVWGCKSKFDSPVEKALLRFGKHIVGVHRKSVNMAVVGELNLKPLKIDMQYNALKFYDYMKQNKNTLLRDSLEEIEMNDSIWNKDVNNTVLKTNFDKNKLYLKDYHDNEQYKKVTDKNNLIIKKTM